MKKEELISKNGVLEFTIEELKANDKNTREEISDAMDAPSRSNGYGERNKTIYTWPEIFVQIGKLMERKEYGDLRSQIKGLQKSMSTVYKKVNESYMKDHPGHYPPSLEHERC